MLGNLARRFVDIAVTVLAIYAFFRVPIGRHTAFGHLAAIFSTEPAHEAADDVRSAGAELRDRAVDGAQRLAERGRDGGR
jgi:hypothetical protein